VTLEEAGLRERSHLQEWVIAHPQILGPDVRIIAFEFGQWIGLSGYKERDRLDVLGLDASGQLVIAELKRGAAPDTVEMQGLKYAAMASRFTLERLGAPHARFLSAQRSSSVTPEAPCETVGQRGERG
jgi:RecB family endonuclease NucS